MVADTDARDRLIALERDVKHLSRQLDDTHAKVEEMHGLFMAARGARWAIVAMASVAGFIAGIAAKMLPVMR